MSGRWYYDVIVKGEVVESHVYRPTAVKRARALGGTIVKRRF